MRLRGFVVRFLVAFAGVAAAEQPQVNSYFADHMVLQRDVAIPVWGQAADGETITVTFAGQTASTTAKDGTWAVKLNPLPASSEPRILTVSNGESGVRNISDILVGDVWVASGQSNMERQLGPRERQKDLIGWKAAVASADYPLIRQYQIPRNTSPVPLDDGNGAWLVCSPDTAPDFSGVGFFFIRDIYESQKVPLALLHTTWGGTPAEAWTSKEKLETLPYYARQIESIEGFAGDSASPRERQEAWLKEHDAGSAQQWWAEETTHSGWSPVDGLALFEEMGIHDFDGAVWFRKEIELPAEAAGRSATLRLGQIDDSDRTWVNGQMVGETHVWRTQREYAVPEGLLKPGRNVITVRVLDMGNRGGWRSAEALELVIGEGAETVSLSGSWQQQAGAALPSDKAVYLRGRQKHRSPAMLYNAMLHSLLPQPIKGVIWYQGESNNGQAEEYEDLFAAMITDWRARWNSGEFPFLYVQIAPYKNMTPELREAQRRVLGRVPNTAMTVTVDVGDAEDIHPAEKGPVGQRLALAARALAYGEDIVYSGPLYRSMATEGPAAVISFTHTGSGLVAVDGVLQGFEIAGADGNFVPAEAEIAGNTVVVSSDQVQKPAAVRYGWSNVPDVNLFNKEGLPASPFTTEAM